MSDKSAIEWTDATWNPTTGCTKISPGCAHCYIERTPAFRIAGRKFVDGHIPLELHRARLERPLHWRKPRMVFVNSLSDLFHEDVPDAFIDRVLLTIVRSPYHTFQVLTKRAERMRRYFGDAGLRDRIDRLGLVNKPLIRARDGTKVPPTLIRQWPMPTLWLGVSVENQHFADERLPLLLQTPAAVRFISAEPLLGPVTLAQFHNGTVTRDWVRGGTRLDWVIVGGESGPQSRPFDLVWARSIIAQCKAAGVACFVKQLGARPTFGGKPIGYYEGYDVTDRKGGNPDEWPVDLRVRQYPSSTWNSPPPVGVSESR